MGGVRMSGGSWDYLCHKVSDAADRLRRSEIPERRAFGEHLKLVSEALHDIEWVDSGDYSDGDEMEAIGRVISAEKLAASSAALLREQIEAATRVLKKLENK